MSRYIDADMLEKDGWNIQRIRQVSSTEMVYETKKPTDFPAADVAEVNRCKTCFHYKPREYGYNCTVLDWDVNEDDFCSRWEAKDE